MRRNTTVLLVFALLLAADGLCIQETLNLWPGLSRSDSVRFMISEVAAAVLLIFLSLRILLPAITGLLRRYNRQAGFAILQPLRRLFVSVWF